MRNNKHINDIVAIDSDMYLPTSFPRSPLFLNFLTRGKKREDPGNEVLNITACYRKCCSLFPPLFAITVIDSYEFVPVMK